MTRTAQDIQSEIDQIKLNNPTWISDAVDKALITALTNQMNLLNQIQVGTVVPTAQRLLINEKQCSIVFHSAVFLVNFHPNDDLREKIISYISTSSIEIPSDVTLSKYEVTDSMDRICSKYDNLEHGQQYVFSMPKKLINDKQCRIVFHSAVFLVNFKPNEDVKETIIGCITKSSVTVPRGVTLSKYELTDAMDSICSQYNNLEHGQQYVFSMPTMFTAVAASQWTVEHVETLLKINFIDDYDFIGQHMQSHYAKSVLDELKDVDGNLIIRYNTNTLLDLEELHRFKNDNIALTSPLTKAMYAAEKFYSSEATVESFLEMLLYRLGYYENWLLPLRQHKYQLEFKDYNKNAICDFCIIDVVTSEALMIISLDYNGVNERVNSEGQLFGSIIGATMQLMRKKRKSPDEEVLITSRERKLFGLRVNGLFFHFYEVEVSDAMLQAVRSGRATNIPTFVKCRRSLDMHSKQDREAIVNILDTWRDAMNNI